MAFSPSPAGGNALDLLGKQGYYYTEDKDNSFDDQFVKHAFTIEFWFCPARITNVNEGWIIVGKLPLYQIELVYDGELEHKRMLVRYSIQADHRSSELWDISAGINYEPQWHHFIVQGSFYESGDNAITFLDGVSRGLGGSQGSGGTITDSDDPFYVGGFPVGTKTVISVGDRKSINADVTTFDGLIDELRISDVLRYDSKFPGESIDIPKRFEPDKYTVALWHFDEEAGSLSYEDASGNGHTLIASEQFGDDTTSITPKQSIPTLWGNTKK